jgi:hypothetical protein
MTSATDAEPDMALIGELLETIETTPPGVEARKLLVEHYVSVGWLEAAQDSAVELLKLSPHDAEVKTMVSTLKNIRGSPSTPSAVTEESQYRALYDYLGDGDNELTLTKNDIVTIIHKENDGTMPFHSSASVH